MRVERVAVGGMYFPWNYRRRASNGRVTRRPHNGDRGRHVFNVLDARGRIIGSADLQIGPRASERMIATEEFEYGGGNGSRGPYLWPDDGYETYIIALRGLWTRRAARRQGVARLLVDTVADFGLPVYVAFGNAHMERWFEAEFKPDDEWAFSEWQDLMHTFEMYAEDPWPSTTSGGRYRWELTCTAMRRVASGEFYDYEPPSLGDLLFSPRRAAWEDLDGGLGETDLADTPFATDRRYGYKLTIDRRQDADLAFEFDGHLEDDAAYDAALDRTVTLSASGELQVTDLDVLRDYAHFRRMLRTGISMPRSPATEAEAVHELLVAAQHQPFDHIIDFQVELR